MTSNKAASDPRTRVTGLIVMITVFAFNLGAAVTLVVDDPNPSKWQLITLAAAALSLVIGLIVVLRDIWKPNAASRGT